MSTIPDTVVVDASVALAIVRHEPEGREAAAALSGWTNAGVRLVVASHFWLEIANSLSRRHRWSGASILEAVHRIDDFRFETIDLDRPLVVLTIDLGERHGLSSYDAAYLALAVALDASLATLDTGLGRAAAERAVRLGPLRLSETTESYEHSVTWPSYRGASAFLAKLRADAVRPG